MAVGQHGYVSTGDAAAIGVPAVELRKLAARGGLERIGHGLYRVSDVPFDDVDQYARAVRLVGPGAHLTQDAVLALHGLGLVNPRRIRVGTPRRFRGALPAFVEVVHEQVPCSAITEYSGIRSTTVARALIDCVGKVMPERLRDAVTQAKREGLLTRTETHQVRQAIRNVP
ncbi:type IV toxin-antitoxin system AbiEi family antitoxin domain-containing protein [Nakamurella alba]|nr:type IV toxin-antitoxin system AbiEi family antitoxin domain-containing protein [Nakamurella alba]